MSFFRSLRRGAHAAESAEPSNTPEPPDTEAAPDTEGPSRLALADGLRTVIDPEVGLNIVALGLIYDLQLEDGTATVRLTMTTPACPMSSYIKQQVGGVLQRVPGLRRGVVELVWDPPWSPHMIEPEARALLFGGRRPPAY